MDKKPPRHIANFSGNKHTITIRVSQEMKDDLIRLSIKAKEPMARVIRELIRKEVKKQEINPIKKKDK